MRCICMLAHYHPSQKILDEQGREAITRVIRTAIHDWCSLLLFHGLIAVPVVSVILDLISHWTAVSGMAEWLSAMLSNDTACSDLCYVICDACNYVRHLLLTLAAAPSIGVLVSPAPSGERFPLLRGSLRFCVYPYSMGVTTVVALGPLLYPHPGYNDIAAAAVARLQESVIAVSESFVAHAGTEAASLIEAASTIRRVLDVGPLALTDCSRFSRELLVKTS